MPIKNEVMLIAYADSMGKNLKDLKYILNKYFKNAIGGVHILPFYPSSADRGFAPLTYSEIDKEFGSWEDLENLNEDFYLMYDFMINHISRQSKFYKNFKKNKDVSPYADFFIRYKDFWPGGEPAQKDIDLIYKRKPRAPYVEVKFEDGTSEKIWCTFDEEQLDLNLNSKVVRDFISDSLIYLAEKGASLIRLDAFAYAIKKIGTSCFFIEPDVWELLGFTKSILEPYGVEILPEIHEHYSIQLKLAEKGYWVYDFALPMLMLYSLYSGSGKRLVNWLKTCPRKQFTVLDTHDGIGVVDVKDLLTEEEIELTKDYLYSRGSNVKKIYSSTAYDNLDIYQVNCTYYSALGNNDDAYLTARTIQFFTPGIPQVYYVGLLVGENDIELLEKTKVGRNINRHYYTLKEIEENFTRPVQQRLINLMKFRNLYPAFDGEYKIHDTLNDEIIKISWKKDLYETILTANLKEYKFSIDYFDPEIGGYKQLIGI
ncbi:MAG: sucrose phosphorylase [Firmicutes bacterium]|nr:sucrose phosphorylase [Bacillota bacterium]